MIPGKGELRRCTRCTRLVLWTVTRAGRYLLVDPKPDERGNQACYRKAPGSWESRSLDAADALPPARWEHRFVPHVATCKPPEPKPPATLPTNVVPFRRPRGNR